MSREEPDILDRADDTVNRAENAYHTGKDIYNTGKAAKEYLDKRRQGKAGEDEQKGEGPENKDTAKGKQGNEGQKGETGKEGAQGKTEGAGAGKEAGKDAGQAAKKEGSDLAKGEGKNLAGNSLKQGAKAAGKEAVKEKAEQVAENAAVKAGTEVAADVTAGASAGTSKLIQAALWAADKATKAILKKLKAWGLGFFDYLYTHKIKFCCLTLLFTVTLLIVTPVILVASIFSMFDRSDTQNQELVSEISTLANSGKLQFVDPQDLKAIEDISNEDVSAPVLKMLKYLGNRHKLTVARYQYGEAVGNKYGTISELPFPDAAAFSIVAVDKIKCTDTSVGKQIPEIAISLSAKHDWTTDIKPEYQTQAEKIICAVGYYPTIDPAVKGNYANTYGPGEFKLSEIGIYGPMASQEKLAETLKDILNADKNTGTDSASIESLIPQFITIDSIFADKNLKTGGKGILNKFASDFNNTYGDEWKQKITGSDGNAFGIQMSFL